MSFLVVADSGANLTNETVDTCSFASVPLKLMIGDKEFIDTPDLDVENLMKEISAYEGKTGSACPSPYDFKDTFAGYDNIFVFTLTGGLSGSYGSACIAKDMELEEHPEKNIHVFDTLSAGPKITLLANYTRQLVEKGLDFTQIVDKINSEIYTNFHLGFILDKLENFVKNGRVSKLTAAAVGVLGIRIVCTASKEGTIEVSHKARNFKIAIKKLISDMEGNGFVKGTVLISHTFNEEGAAEAMNSVLEKFPGSSISIMKNNGLCSYYSEYGGLLIGYTNN